MYVCIICCMIMYELLYINVVCDSIYDAGIMFGALATYVPYMQEMIMRRNFCKSNDFALRNNICDF